MDYYLEVLKKYAVFDGRARRAEYWYFTLFNIIFGLVAGLLDMFLSLPNIGSYGLLYLIYILALFIPSLAVAIRRLHDVGKSGWMILVGLIPLAGLIWLLILFIRDSQPGDNQYGPNPKGIAPVSPVETPTQA